jgi:hypothetical protein
MCRQASLYVMLCVMCIAIAGFVATAAATTFRTDEVVAPVSTPPGQTTTKQCVLVWRRTKHWNCCLQTNWNGCARYDVR